jgi:hypothetical protein
MKDSALTIEDQRSTLGHFIAAATRAIGIAELSSQALQKSDGARSIASVRSRSVGRRAPLCRQAVSSRLAYASFASPRDKPSLSSEALALRAPERE